MQRLIEQPAAEGDVLESGRRLGRVHYHLSVYQHFSDREGEAVPSHIEVEGRITPIDAVDFGTLRRRDADLTLRLVDGRVLECRITRDDGTIRSTGRGLRVAE
jgi:hypothetical protein